MKLRMNILPCGRVNQLLEEEFLPLVSEEAQTRAWGVRVKRVPLDFHKGWRWVLCPGTSVEEPLGTCGKRGRERAGVLPQREVTTGTWGVRVIPCARRRGVTWAGGRVPQRGGRARVTKQ